MKWGIGLTRRKIVQMIGVFVTKNNIKTPFKLTFLAQTGLLTSRGSTIWVLKFLKRLNMHKRSFYHEWIF